MNQWRKDIAWKRMDRRLYLSIPFTWLLPKAHEMARRHTQGPVFAGGPAVDLMPQALEGVARVGEKPPGEQLIWHNPSATFTTRGCPNRCPFCAVPRLEGEFRELKDWPARPVICDNNLLAASKAHFEKVIESIRRFPVVDFQQGLEARRFTPYHAEKIAGLHAPHVRFAFDHISHESAVADAVALARKKGIPKDHVHVYVLIGFNDTPEDASYRLSTIWSWGIYPNPMRYQPLNAVEKNAYVDPAWTARELKRLTRYWSRLRFFKSIPFDEYEAKDLPLLGLIDGQAPHETAQEGLLGGC